MKRVICVWLPNWPITRLSLTSPDCAVPDKPLAIVEVHGSKRRILTVTALLAYGVWVMRANLAPAATASKLRIEVVGESWWWRIAYRDKRGARIADANEIRISPLPDGFLLAEETRIALTERAIGTAGVGVVADHIKNLQVWASRLI